MDELTTDANRPAVVVGAVISFLAGGMFAKKSAYARSVDAGYRVVSSVIMIICLGVFRNI